MKKGRFTEQQIVSVLRKQEADIAIKEISPELGIGEAPLYDWKNSFKESELSEYKKMVIKQSVSINQNLKKTQSFREHIQSLPPNMQQLVTGNVVTGYGINFIGRIIRESTGFIKR